MTSGFSQAHEMPVRSLMQGATGDQMLAGMNRAFLNHAAGRDLREISGREARTRKKRADIH
jgi:hypothetical protein